MNKQISTRQITEHLESTIGKVVFYSGLYEPISVNRIVKIWKYVDNSFFFHKKQVEILKKLSESNLVEKTEKGYQSNYDAAINLVNMKKFFVKWREDLEKDFILAYKDFFNKNELKDLNDANETSLKDKSYRQFIFSKYPNIEKRVNNLCFDEIQIKKIYDLWSSKEFRQVFLNPTCLSVLWKKDELKSNPVELLMIITHEFIVDRIYETRSWSQYDYTEIPENIGSTYKDEISEGSFTRGLKCIESQLTKMIDNQPKFTTKKQIEFRSKIEKICDIYEKQIRTEEKFEEKESKASWNQSTTVNDLIDDLGKSKLNRTLAKIKHGYDKIGFDSDSTDASKHLLGDQFVWNRIKRVAGKGKKRGGE